MKVIYNIKCDNPEKRDILRKLIRKIGAVKDIKTNYEVVLTALKKMDNDL